MYNLQLTEVSRPLKLKNLDTLPLYFGSSLNRKKTPKKPHEKSNIYTDPDTGEKIDLETDEVLNEKQTRSIVEATAQQDEPKEVQTKEIEHKMSSRSKRKIRNKMYQWFTTQPDTTFTFLTLTFINAVDDKTANRCLNDFFNVVRKYHKNFEYVWVIERQHKNTINHGNPHYHILNNIKWDIKAFNRIWINIQQKRGIINEKTGKVTSEHHKHLNPFDIKKVMDVRKLSMYMTKYVTKNTDTFKARVWGCSRGVSALFTGVRVSNDTAHNITNDNLFTRYNTRHGVSVSLGWHTTDYAQIHKLANPHLLILEKPFQALKLFNQRALKHIKQKPIKDTSIKPKDITDFLQIISDIQQLSFDFEFKIPLARDFYQQQHIFVSHKTT